MSESHCTRVHKAFRVQCLLAHSRPVLTPRPLPATLPLAAHIAYLSHGHFSWRELAKESSDRRAAQAQLMKSQAGAMAAADPEQQQGKARAHRIKDSVLQRLVQQQNLLQSQQEATKAAQAAQQAKEGAQAASTQSQDQKTPAAAAPAAEAQAQQEKLQGKAADSGSKPSAIVSVAAVDNIHLLMPTSMDETGMCNATPN